MHRPSSTPLRAVLLLTALALAACEDSAKPAPPWQRPETPTATTATGLSWIEDPEHDLTWFFADGELLALYNNGGNTFIEFWKDGVNLIGGYDRGHGRTNLGTGHKGHGAGYPFGQVDPQLGFYGQWEGFWAGYGYMDTLERWGGVNGNTDAQVEVSQAGADAVDVHMQVTISHGEGGRFAVDVHYLVTRDGIGVRDDVTVLSDLHPLGFADTGGQLLMTQIDTDLDPALAYDEDHQPDQYFQLAMDGYVQQLDPFPPYNYWSPSNIYTDFEQYDPAHPESRVHGLPNGALVTTEEDLSYLTAKGRQSRSWNLALRVDRTRSVLPQLEYYCELNGDRDFLNYLYSAHLGEGTNVTVVPAGTIWHLYGDLRPWQGTDAEALRTMPLLSDSL